MGTFSQEERACTFSKSPLYLLSSSTSIITIMTVTVTDKITTAYYIPHTLYFTFCTHDLIES